LGEEVSGTIVVLLLRLGFGVGSVGASFLSSHHTRKRRRRRRRRPGGCFVLATKAWREEETGAIAAALLTELC
jgi:hypothetical protein